MEGETISVIIPAYNVAPWLPRCLDSVLAQTYSKLEIIVVDDGSADNTRQVMEDYAARDGRIRPIFKENGGVTSARLAGVAAATGEWVGFADGDDAIDPDMYRHLLENAHTYDADISHCGHRVEFPDGRVAYVHNTGELRQQDNLTGLRDLLDGSGTYQIHWLATDVTLPESVELIAGFGKQLTAQVRPADDPNLALTWTSSDETVVQVDETGMCTGIAPGTAVITASAGGGAYSAQCQVTVLENSAPHYEDVPESAWYYEAVQYTSAHGLFQGMTETKFGPNLTMTRGMLVTVLYRMEGEPAVEGQTHPFTDVDASRYYGDAITWAANSGVVNGMTDTRFAPEAAVTREQMVTILYRYAKLKDADVTAKGDLESFPDHDQVKPYARDAFSWAVGAGIIQGDSNGSVATLSPRNSATRAQVAAVLMRYLEQLG